MSAVNKTKTRNKIRTQTGAMPSPFHHPPPRMEGDGDERWVCGCMGGWVGGCVGGWAVEAVVVVVVVVVKDVVMVSSGILHPPPLGIPRPRPVPRPVPGL